MIPHNISSASPRWRELDVQSLGSILNSRQGLDSVLETRGGDAVAVVDLLDQALDASDLDPRQQKLYAMVLPKLCGTCGILPTSHMLTEGLKMVGDQPHSAGGFSDVWRASYKGCPVAVKALRTYATDDLAKVTKRFCKEALVWKRLRHQNVLSFLGVSASDSVFPFCMVSNWMPHGNVVDFVNANPGTNRLVLLSDVARGLDYLHKMDLVHGDLKGANILISSDYLACLSDFGLMTIIDPHSTHSATSSSSGGTVRWMAPELLYPEEHGLKHSIPRKESDVYALGMVIFEIMTGTLPFNQYTNLVVIPKILNGLRPERPAGAVAFGLSDAVWQVAEDCWRQHWSERPMVRAVLDRLNEAATYWLPPPSTIVNSPLDVDYDSDTSTPISYQFSPITPDAHTRCPQVIESFSQHATLEQQGHFVQYVHQNSVSWVNTSSPQVSPRDSTNPASSFLWWEVPIMLESARYLLQCFLLTPPNDTDSDDNRPWEIPGGADTQPQLTSVQPENLRYPDDGFIIAESTGARVHWDSDLRNQHLVQRQPRAAQANTASQVDYSSGDCSATQQHLHPNISDTSSPYPNANDSANARSTRQLKLDTSGQQYSNHSTPGRFLLPQFDLNHPPTSPYHNTSIQADAHVINGMGGAPRALTQFQDVNPNFIGLSTPMLDRDASTNEWKRQQIGKTVAAQPYMHSDCPQQPTEFAAYTLVDPTHLGESPSYSRSLWLQHVPAQPVVRQPGRTPPPSIYGDAAFATQW